MAAEITTDFEPYLLPRSAPREGRFVTAAEAIDAIPDASRVWVASITAAPLTLMDELVARRERFTELELITNYLLEPLAPFAHPNDPFRLTTLQACVAAGAMFEAGAARIVPSALSQWSGLLAPGAALAPDVVIAQVSEPGPDGRVSLGTGVSSAIDVVRSAPLVIAEVNPRMPYTFGAGELTLDHFDLLVEVEHELLEYPPAEAAEVEETIAEYAAGEIEDGATLQFGIGALPAAILERLTDRTDLGLHGGIVGDPCIDLIEKGIATGARKSRDPGIAVGGEVLGSRRVFDWVHRNEAVRTVPSAYSHGPVVLAQCNRFTAINSTVAISSDGTIGAEMAGSRIISGPGGQPDYAIGADLSSGGVSILAFPSTASRGRRSRIVSQLEPGVPVTVPRYLADRVVTEFGVARLKGHTIEERVELMRAITHPDFRDAL